jgi:DNA-binding Lrp family transcriptional regulator
LAEFNPNGEERVERLNSGDPVVRRVLAALIADARHDPARIAALTGIGEDQVAALVGQLERQRVIRGYKIVVDWDRLGDERVVASSTSASPRSGKSASIRWPRESTATPKSARSTSSQGDTT